MTSVSLTIAPTPFTPELALDLLYLALAKELGIIVPVDDTKDAPVILNAIYTARKDINDPRLACLSIHVPADASALFIYKKEVELDD